MLCTPGFWEDAYQALKEDALSGATTARRVLLFVATSSCDSIATLQILEHVLNKDNVPYGIYPVANESELVQRSEEMLQDDCERSVICIGCGANCDIRSTLSCGPGVRVYVFDSHRPLNMKNAQKDNSQVLVMCEDGEVEDEGLGNLLDDENNASSSSSEDDDSSDESDEDEDDVDEEARHQKRAKRQRRERRKEYNARGASYSQASGCIAYDFASHLNKDDVSCLWKAIVSLTDHYIHQRLTHESYMRSVVEYERKIGMTMDNHPPASSSVTNSAGRTKRIQYKEDCHLVMLQHWSLADALFNSPYVATRLRTWKESGKEKIELMLAKMGFPLVECQQHWTHMSPKLKQKLTSKLQECAPQFGLVNFQFASFQKEDGYASTSSSDMVHAVTALLEVGSIGSFNSESKGEGEGEDRQTNDSGVEAFWAAYESLTGKRKDLVQKGLDLAMQVQKVLCSVAGAQLNNRRVMTCGKFRYLNLEDIGGESQHQGMFHHPLVLSRLGFFLQDAHVHMGRSRKPMLVVGPPSSNGDVMVVLINIIKGIKGIIKGIIGAEEYGFESNVIKLPHLDVQQFLDELLINLY